MTTEVITQVEQWIYGTLTSSGSVTALVSTRVFEEAAPREVNGAAVTFPLVIFSHRPGNDMNTLNGYRVMTKIGYVIKVVGEGNTRGIRAVYQAVDAALLAGPFPTAVLGDGGIVLSCIRTQPIKYAESFEGKIYRHLGGYYEIEVQ